MQACTETALNLMEIETIGMWCGGSTFVANMMQAHVAVLPEIQHTSQTCLPMPAWLKSLRTALCNGKVLHWQAHGVLDTGCMHAEAHRHICFPPASTCSLPVWEDGAASLVRAHAFLVPTSGWLMLILRG